MSFEYKVRKASYALSKTILPGLDYSLNPYFGCSHGCVYCYARKFFLMRKMSCEWGKYVEVKENIPDLLARELKRVPRGSTIGLGTSTDPYQPLEAEFKITGKALSILSKRDDLTVEVQTKSTLVLRDLELISNSGNITVGFTILTVDDELGRFLEPHAAAVSERFKALKKLGERKVETWIFIGPILPWITDDEENLEKLVKLASEAGVGKIYGDKLRFRLGVRESLVKALSRKSEALSSKYRNLREGDLLYRYSDAIKILSRACRKLNIEFEDVSYF